MKNTSLALSAATLLAICATGILTLNSCIEKKAAEPAAEVQSAAPNGSIVYFNLDRVVNEYDMANELRTAVESKVQGISDEVNRRGNRLQNDVNSFQEKLDKGLITRSVAEVQSQQLGQRQQEFQNYAAQKQQEINEEQTVMMNQIGDAIKKYLDKFNETAGYSMIIANSGDILPSPVVAADTTLDITDVILKGLNEEYVKTKAAGASK